MARSARLSSPASRRTPAEGKEESFSITTTRGSPRTAAKLRPSWNWPVEVAPPMMKATAAQFLPCIRAPSRRPTTTGTMAPGAEVPPITPRSRSQKWRLPSFPPQGPPERARAWRNSVRGGQPRASTAPRSRKLGATKSPAASAKAAPTEVASRPMPSAPPRISAVSVGEPSRPMPSSRETSPARFARPDSKASRSSSLRAIDISRYSSRSCGGESPVSVTGALSFLPPLRPLPRGARPHERPRRRYGSAARGTPWRPPP